MAWVELQPGYESLLRQGGRESAASFLDWTGILVNRHRHRQVELVTLPDAFTGPASAGQAPRLNERSFYLKKEHAATWRQRCRNAWHGFGWCATAVREARLLQALRQAGVGCPEVAAFGEDRRRAFVLLRDEHDMTELRAFLPTLADEEQQRLAEALGRELAHMHDAGFNHPDLFAKHILVKREGATFRFCLLDWQRGGQHGAVPWRMRCRDLAVLDATLHATLASDRLRLRCLQTYRRSLTNPPPLGRLARQIRRAAVYLRRKRHIREIGQLPVPAREQQFVQLHQGRLLVVRSYYEERGGKLPEEWTRNIMTDPPGACELPALAHTLFRLHRFGVPAPRLLAASRGFLHSAIARTVPLEDALANATSATRSCLLERADAIVRQVRAAGYRLPAGEDWLHRLGVVPDTNEVMLVRVEPLEEHAADAAPSDQAWIPSLTETRERQAAG